MDLQQWAGRVILLTAVVAAGCSSSSVGPSPNPNDAGNGFVGTWQCTGVGTNTETEPISETTTEPTTASTTITSDGSSQFTVTRTPETDAGTPPCTETFILAAGGATLTGKTPIVCPLATKTITQTFTSVVYTLDSSGTTYTTAASYTDTGTTATGKAYKSTGTSTSTCTKSP
jgi:hypothetical protein